MREQKFKPDVVQQAMREMEINPEKVDPMIS
jgi:hypothetical protein